MSEYTAEMAHAAVARGAAWLDRRCPDWVREIDLHKLDLSDVDVCILGQTAECLLPEDAKYDSVNYGDVVQEFAPVAQSAWARRFGFEVPEAPDGHFLRYEMLTIAWKELIRQRLEAQP